MDSAHVIEENHIVFQDPHPNNISGGFGDIFIGEHITVGRVAVKRLRLSPAAKAEDSIRRFKREGDTWRKLQFQFLLPFIGFYYMAGQICLVSPFAKNGSLPTYLELHADANRRLLLFQTALAIAYLHGCGVIHGDIKGENILISNEHTALLSDFGLARPEDVVTSAGQKGMGTVPWQSPELLEGGSKSYKSDIYAFGMTIYEVLSGERPFSQYPYQAPIIAAVLVRRERPAQFPSESAQGESYGWLWTVAEQCWQTEPRDRLTALEVAGFLHPEQKATRAVFSRQLQRVVGVACVSAFFLDFEIN